MRDQILQLFAVCLQCEIFILEKAEIWDPGRWRHMDLECLCQKDKLTLHPNKHIPKQPRNIHLNLPPTKVIFRFFFPKLKNNDRKPPKSFNLILAIFSPSMPEGYKIIYNRKPLISELLCLGGFFIFFYFCNVPTRKTQSCWVF